MIAREERIYLLAKYCCSLKIKRFPPQKKKFCWLRHRWTWAQFGGGRGGRVPLSFFSLDFVFGEVSKTKVMFVTFCMKSFSC